MSIDTRFGLRPHRYVWQKVIIVSVIRLWTEELNTCMIMYTAGKLLALQPTNVTIPWTMRTSIFGFRRWRPHKQWCRVTSDFRHLTCFPAPTQLVTVSQENTRRCLLSAVVMQSPRSVPLKSLTFWRYTNQIIIIIIIVGCLNICSLLNKYDDVVELCCDRQR